jgi:hypothetical protein
MEKKALIFKQIFPSFLKTINNKTLKLQLLLIWKEASWHSYFSSLEILKSGILLIDDMVEENYSILN